MYNSSLFSHCPNVTHNPKIFSWHEAAKICWATHATLPEFFNNRDQEEIINIVKESRNMFPIQALYLGLKYRQVSLMLFDPQLCTIFFVTFIVPQTGSLFFFTGCGKEVVPCTSNI